MTGNEKTRKIRDIILVGFIFIGKDDCDFRCFGREIFAFLIPLKKVDGVSKMDAGCKINLFSIFFDSGLETGNVVFSCRNGRRV